MFSPACATTSESKVGFDELFQKIKEMHLDHLIFLKTTKANKKDLSEQDNLPDLSSDEAAADSSSDLPWWFLG